MELYKIRIDGLPVIETDTYELVYSRGVRYLELLGVWLWQKASA